MGLAALLAGWQLVKAVGLAAVGAEGVRGAWRRQRLLCVLRVWQVCASANNVIRALLAGCSAALLIHPCIRFFKFEEADVGRCGGVGMLGIWVVLPCGIEQG